LRPGFWQFLKIRTGWRASTQRSLLALGLPLKQQWQLALLLLPVWQLRASVLLLSSLRVLSLLRAWRRLV